MAFDGCRTKDQLAVFRHCIVAVKIMATQNKYQTELHFMNIYIYLDLLDVHKNRKFHEESAKLFKGFIAPSVGRLGTVQHNNQFSN